MRFIPHPTDKTLLVNVDEMVSALRDPLRLTQESNDENARLAADFVEAYAAKIEETQ